MIVTKNDKTLGSVIEDWESGVLSVLTSDFEVPWKESITTGNDLDLDYLSNRSCNKLISNLVKHLLGENESLSSENLNKLASIIFNKYNENWKRIWYALSLEYNPIYNYMGDEESTDREVIDSNKSNTVNKEETITNTGTQRNVENGTNTGTQSNDITVEYKGSESDSSTKLNTGTQSTDNSTEYKGSESDSSTKTNTGTQTTVEDTEDNTTYGFNNYKEETSYGKTTDDTLTFTNRKREKTIDGGYSDTHTPTNYTTTTESYAKSYNQQRRNAFNGGLTVVTDNEDLSGVGNGAGGAGGTPGQGSGNTNKTTVIESGSYKDSRDYTNDYKETDTDSGSENRDITLGGHDDLKISGNKTDNKDIDSTTTRTDNLSESNQNTHSFTNRVDETSNLRTDNLSESLNSTHSFSNRKDETSNLRTDNLSHSNDITRTDNLTQGLNSEETGNEELDSTRELTHTNHREGNYGVRSTQEMLTQEFVLRQTYNFFDSIVFPDIDKVLVNGLFPKRLLY